jgi:two-component system NtrC family sensor kinase
MTQLSLHHVDLSLDLASDLPTVYADANQIQQVVVNLLLNAADAIGTEGGSIRATTRRVPSSSIELLLKDSGCGIPPEDLPRIFEPFFTTKGNHGTGLGLAVSWGIVEAHGGSLEVQSELGHGTTFTLRLSTVAAPEGGSPPSLATLT